MKVEVVPHDPSWKQAFQAEASQVSQALGENIVAIHHIGSTAIATIYAKPIIDLLVEVRALLEVDAHAPAMQALGYEAMGELGIPGRRYFRKENHEGIRTHHVHAFEAGSPQVQRHLLFRNYLRVHDDEAQQYSSLKRQLAQEHPQDIYAYMDGKDAFIKEIDRRAAAWFSQGC
jgi:GrpB-like predicted nucleotidyltransferase (UPF0157 family)